jgi:hypothetical protein
MSSEKLYCGTFVGYVGLPFLVAKQTISEDAVVMPSHWHLIAVCSCHGVES